MKKGTLPALMIALALAAPVQAADPGGAAAKPVRPADAAAAPTALPAPPPPPPPGFVTSTGNAPPATAVPGKAPGAPVPAATGAADPPAPSGAMSREEPLERMRLMRERILQGRHDVPPAPGKAPGAPVPAAPSAETPPAVQPRPSVLASGHYKYSVKDGNVTITGFNKSYSGALVIPSTLGGCTVTSVRARVFWDCASLTNVTIPASVTLFSPDGTMVGDAAFYRCTSLNSVTVDSANPSYRSVDGVLFNKDVTRLIQYPPGRVGPVTIPASVSVIGDTAFSGCSGLTQVTIPASVSKLGSSPFQGCTDLTSITVEPENLSYSSLGGILLDEDLKTLIWCPAKKEGFVAVPTSVTSIAGFAFSDCAGLTSVTIPANVTSIGEYAFRNCIGLTSLTIPASVTSIGKCRVWKADLNSFTEEGCSVFARCPNLTAIATDERNPAYSSLDGVLYGKSPTTVLYCPRGKKGQVAIPDSVTSVASFAFSGCTGLTSVTMPNTVTSIGDSAFSGCAGLTNVTISNGVTSIGNYAFQRCTGLTDVTIPNSVIGIGDSAFSECTGLINVTIGNGVTGIGNEVFRDCATLTQITIPASVTRMGSSVFGGCTNLTAIAVDGGNRVWSSVDGILFDKNASTLLNCPRGKQGQVQIPASATRIGDSAFSGCTGLTSVTIPNGVNRIGGRAFSGCTGLTSVIIPNSVGVVEGWAFQGCTGLTSVAIPASVSGIGTLPFSACRALTAIRVDAANTRYCDVNGVLFNKDKTELIEYPSGKTGSYTIPASVTSVGKYPFLSCANLTGIVVEPTNPAYASLGGVLFSKDMTALIRCPAGATGTVTVPDGVTSIGIAAFDDCTGLTKIMIPASVIQVDGGAPFIDCANLTGIYFQGTAPRIDDRVFDKDSRAIVYYRPDVAGWGKAFGGRPTAVWDLKASTDDTRVPGK